MSFTFDGSKPKVIEFTSVKTDWKKGELIRPSGGISLCLRSPAHSPNEDATNILRGCLFHLAELAGFSSRVTTSLTSSGKMENMLFREKSDGLTPPHNSLVSTYHIFCGSRESLVTLASEDHSNFDAAAAGGDGSSSMPAKPMTSK